MTEPQGASPSKAASAPRSPTKEQAVGEEGAACLLLDRFLKVNAGMETGRETEANPF